MINCIKFNFFYFHCFHFKYYLFNFFHQKYNKIHIIAIEIEIFYINLSHYHIINHYDHFKHFR
jgi:hypothetical protein